MYMWFLNWVRAIPVLLVDSLYSKSDGKYGKSVYNYPLSLVLVVLVCELWWWGWDSQAIKCVSFVNANVRLLEITIKSMIVFILKY